jgi:hypothetical protein
MADTKISALTSASLPLAGTEVLPIVQSSNTVKVTVAGLTSNNVFPGNFTTMSGNSVTSTTPVLSFNASNTIASFGSTTSGSYNQLVIQNQSNSANASTNYVISNNLGTDSSYYGEFGMNSSTFSASTPSDFYSINNGVYFSGHDGDISVGSGNGYKIYFPYGATPNNAHVINASGALGLSTNLGTTPATSGTTGYGTSGQPLLSGGSSAAPTWGTVTGTGAFVLTSAPAISNPTITAYLETAPTLTNSSTAVTLSLSSGTVLSYTLTGNCTFTMPTATSGTSFILKLIQDGTGSRTATFTGVKWPGGTAPTITTTASTGLDILSFVCINSVWYGTYAQAFA